MSIKHLAIAGHIGVGKSSLTQLLADAFQLTTFAEPNINNPFLKKFYEDMSMWAFHSQVYFLVHKFNAHREFLETTQSFIQDRSIYEDAEIFAEHLKQSNRMTNHEFTTYNQLYQEFVQMLPAPDLMIYLHASVDTLYERIKYRGRPEEQNIPRDYMESLHQLYESWFQHYNRSPKLMIEVDHLDFVNSEVDQNIVLEMIQKHIDTLCIDEV
jgi:deoxyadenosine/deoxycytidine kinase